MIIVDNNTIRVEKLTLGPYETNAYIAVCKKTSESLAVDAPAGASEIIKHLEGTRPKYILLTHDHYDHTGVIVSLRARLKAPLATHAESAYRLKTPPDIFVKDGDILPLGELKVEVICTPGHTPGSTCFKIAKYVFAGDTIFPGGPGHTDFPDAFIQIIKSLKEKIFTLPDNTLLLPGHGDDTTVRKAKKEYATFTAKTHPEDLYGDVTWKM